MSAEPVRRPAPRRPSGRTAPQTESLAAHKPIDRRVSSERRRRAQHFRRRRRDLLEDVATAIVLMAVVLTMTAGLGVVAIIAVPIATVLIGSLVAERVITKKRAERSGRTRRPSRVYDLAATDRRPASSPRARPGPTVTQRRGRSAS
jgi:hypothetical protein